MAILKMGTRGSALALAQSGQAARALEKLHPGLSVETVVVKTTGDMFGAPPPAQAKLLPQGAKGLWVKEIEEALLDKTVDFAVHSAKDLPANLLEGLSVAAYPEREDARDAFVGRGGASWDSMKAGARVATSSLRRRLQMSAAKPGLAFVPVRGNVDTRLRKLEEGEFEGLVLAEAGLKRLGKSSAPHELLDPAVVIPAPAQGALALEIRSDRAEIAKIVSALDHTPTRLCVELERFFLAEVEGGCGSPVGAYAHLVGSALHFRGFFAHEGEGAGRRVGGNCRGVDERAAFAREMAAQATRR